MHGWERDIGVHTAINSSSDDAFYYMYTRAIYEHIRYLILGMHAHEIIPT